MSTLPRIRAFCKILQKKIEETTEKEKGEQWKQAKRTASSRQNNKNKAKETGNKSGQEDASNQNSGSREANSIVGDKNPFESLTPPADPSEAEQEDPPQMNNADIQEPGNIPNPNSSNIPSPSYVDIIKQKKKNLENTGSSDEETFERP